MELFEIAYIEHNYGNQCTFRVGRDCDEIRKVERPSDGYNVPWLEVWKNGQIVAEFSPYKLNGMFYREATPPTNAQPANDNTEESAAA